MTRAWTNRLLLLVALALAAFYLFPLYWMYVTAVKSQTEIYASPPTFWPTETNLGIFAYVWESRNMGSYLTNSVIIASGVTTLTVVLGVGLAYVLARYRNVWIDLCWSPLLSPTLFKQSLHEAIEVLPDESRMMIGGDNWHAEETYGAMTLSRRTLAEVLEEKVRDGYFTEADAERLAPKILGDNATAFFGLDRWR